MILLCVRFQFSQFKQRQTVRRGGWEKKSKKFQKKSHNSKYLIFGECKLFCRGQIVVACKWDTENSSRFFFPSSIRAFHRFQMKEIRKTFICLQNKKKMKWNFAIALFICSFYCSNEKYDRVAINNLTLLNFLVPFHR